MSAKVATAAASEWRTVKLGDVLTLHYGKALDRSARTPSGKVPVYGANGIKDSADRPLCEGPTLVIGRKGSAGEITRVEGPFWPLDVTYYTEHDRRQIDFDYMAYALSMLDLPSLARGVKPGINRNDVYALDLQLPPLEEQTRIVAVLDQAFAALDRARANAEANLADATELFDASLRSILQSVAQGTPEHTLTDLTKTVVDCEHKTAPLADQGYPSIRTPNVGKGVLNLEGVNRVSERTYMAWTRRATPEPGDLIMAREAPAGNVAVIPPNLKVCLGQRTLLIKPDRSTTNSEYLAALLLHPQLQERLLAKSAGATVTHVNMSDIRALPVPHLPSLQEQLACAGRIGEVRTKVEQTIGMARRKLRDLSALRQSLLQKAFAGELT